MTRVALAVALLSPTDEGSGCLEAVSKVVSPEIAAALKTLTAVFDIQATCELKSLILNPGTR